MQSTLWSDQKVPVYFANFVLIDYGFGAVFGCPAHDQRFDFAKKYNLEIKTVVRKDKDETFKVINEAYPGPGLLLIDFLNGLSAPEDSVMKQLKS